MASTLLLFIFSIFTSCIHSQQLGTIGNPALSCLEIQNQYGNVNETTPYYIDPDGVSGDTPAFSVRISDIL